MQSLISTVRNTSMRNAKEQEENQNYFRLMQGVHLRELRLLSMQSAHNALLLDILLGLRRRREAAATIAAETARLKAGVAAATASTSRSRQSAAQKAAQAAALSVFDGSTAVLRVNLNLSGQQVVLYKGQWIHTPMGDGQITGIFPAQHRVVVKLSFGVMYCNLRRLVTWGPANGEGLDLTSEASLPRYCNQALATLSVPPAAERMIRQLVDPLRDAADDDEYDRADAADEGEAKKNDGGDAGAGMDVDDTDAQSVASVGSAAAGDEEARENTRRPLSDSLTLQQGSSSSSSSSATGGAALIGGANIGSLDGLESLFPLPMHLPAKGSAEALLSRRALRAEAKRDFGDHPLSSAPLLFAPPAALPALVDHALNSSTVKPRLVICPAALSGAGRLGATGHLAWDADLPVMRSALQTLGAEIRRLEDEQLSYIVQTARVRQQCSQLAVDTSALRMSMFTRRLRHRSNLYAHGVSPSMPVPVLSSSVPAQMVRGAGGDGLSAMITAAEAESGDDDEEEDEEEEEDEDEEEEVEKAQAPALPPPLPPVEPTKESHRSRGGSAAKVSSTTSSSSNSSSGISRNGSSSGAATTAPSSSSSSSSSNNGSGSGSSSGSDSGLSPKEKEKEKDKDIESKSGSVKEEPSTGPRKRVREADILAAETSATVTTNRKRSVLFSVLRLERGQRRPLTSPSPSLPPSLPHL